MTRFLLLAAILLCHSSVTTEAADAVRFFDDITAARASTETPLPVVISFGAPWCGWCRKMTTETFGDQQVQDVAEQYLWVKIDTEKQPDLAARFGVRGIPHTAVLDDQGRLLASQPGYMAPAKFVTFLETSLKNPPMELEQSAAELAAGFVETPTRERLLELVERLAQPQRSDRKPLLAALDQHRVASWPILVELLNDSRLAIRAASAAALAHSAESGPEFDPFADSQLRQSQAAAWKQWVQQHLPEQPPAAVPESKSNPDSPPAANSEPSDKAAKNG